MPSHPYASAYSSLPNPFIPPLQQDFRTNSYVGQTEKKPRIADLGEGSSGGGREGESDGDEDDEEEDDEDGEDGFIGSGKGTLAGRVKGKGGKGDSKQKVKLTRGSRYVFSR